MFTLQGALMPTARVCCCLPTMGGYNIASRTLVSATGVSTGFKLKDVPTTTNWINCNVE